MGASQASVSFIALALMLFAMRSTNSLVADIVKRMLGLCAVGTGLLILPFDFLDNWSKQAAGFAHTGPKFIPLICVILLVALSLNQIRFVSGTAVEDVVKFVLYVIGGVFAVGSTDWVHLSESVAATARGLLGLASAILGIVTGGLAA
jgi:hypothetical protein